MARITQSTYFYCSLRHAKVSVINMSTSPDTAAPKSPATTRVDRIIQLARLGSDPQAIDPLLDSLRLVTSTWDGVSPLPPESETRLVELEKNLRSYLLNKDPLRNFTTQTLETHLKTKSTNRIRALQELVTTLVVSSLTASLGVWLPVFGVLPWDQGFTLMIPLFLLVLHTGIAWQYISTLGTFNAAVRRAFTFICTGIVLLSVAFSHYVAIELLGLNNLEFLHYGGLTLLVAASYFFIYAGLKMYAGLLGVRSFWTSWRNLLGVSAAVVLAACLAPHGGQVQTEWFFDLGLSGMWLFCAFLVFAAGVAGNIIKNVTVAYARSMRWLHIYLLIGCVGSLGGVIALPVFGQLNGGFLYTLIAVMGIPPQLLLLYTGYSFKKEIGGA